LIEFHSLFIKIHDHNFSPNIAPVNLSLDKQDNFVSKYTLSSMGFYQRSFQFSPFDLEETVLVEKLAEEEAFRRLKRQAYKESKILRVTTSPGSILSSISSISSIWTDSLASRSLSSGAAASFVADADEKLKLPKASTSIDNQKFGSISSILGSYNPGFVPMTEFASTISREKEHRAISRHSLLVKCTQPPALKKARRVINKLEAQVEETGSSSRHHTSLNPLIRSKL
jgi:hypothetical protein